jgi:serine/threonine protein kinase
MILYLNTLQLGECVELFKILKSDGRICVTKRTKIGENGFACPRFLREIACLKRISNPPQELENHPGRNHIIKLLDVYEDHGYLHFDMEQADGTLNDLIDICDISTMKEKILVDVSKALHYIHQLGFDHGDISLNNIVYFKKENKFALIDFGNAMYSDLFSEIIGHVRNNRYLTLELSTYYCLPLEKIRANNLMLKLSEIFRSIKNSANENSAHKNSANKNSANKNIITHLESLTLIMNEIQKETIHKKSDTWSLGSLSYYLHTYNFYANGKSLAHQEQLIYSNISLFDSTMDSDNNFISKTKMMLINEHTLRPTVYFYEPNDININSEKKHNVFGKNKKIKPNLNKGLYDNVIRNVISNIAIINNKTYFINCVVDKIIIDNMISRCNCIENNVVNNIKNFINMIPSIKNNSIINTICIIRIIIVWLVSHFYMNDVWLMDDIVLYVSKLNLLHCDNKRPNSNINDKNSFDNLINYRNMIMDVSISIINILNWESDLF